MKRFITEYATYKTNEIKGNLQIQDSIKNERLKRINATLTFSRAGFITIDEAIRLINEA